MKWNPSHQPNEGTEIAKLPIRKGSWEYSPIFEEVRTAKAWGLTISQFWELPDEEQAMMIACIQTEGQMETWEDQVQAKKIESEYKSSAKDYQ